MIRWAAFLVLWTAASLGWAGDPPVPPAQLPDTALGMTPVQVLQSKGAPEQVFPLAVDASRWQVVFFYADHTYLFWDANHVWQVRLDHEWNGSLLGVTMGMSRTDVENTLGKPQAQGETWAVWPLPYQAFPRKIRLIFVNGVLSDAYLYRSDL